MHILIICPISMSPSFYSSSHYICLMPTFMAVGSFLSWTHYFLWKLENPLNFCKLLLSLIDLIPVQQVESPLPCRSPGLSTRLDVHSLLTISISDRHCPVAHLQGFSQWGGPVVMPTTKGVDPFLDCERDRNAW